MSTGRLALFFALAALMLSTLALHRVISLEEFTLQSETQGMTFVEPSLAAPSPRLIGPEIDPMASRKETVARKQTETLVKKQVRRLSMRGSEEVINIGVDLDVDAIYSAPTDQQEVIDIGVPLDANQYR